MIEHIYPTDIPGLFNVVMDDGRMLFDLTTNQVLSMTAGIPKHILESPSEHTSATETRIIASR